MRGAGADDAVFKACCAATYGSDLASAVLGPTYHPGGRELTRRLARMACVRPGERVLDVASGPGHTAFLLAEEFDAVVRGIDLSPTLVERASSAASERKLAERVSFEVADAERLRAGQEHDLVFCECALCTFPDKRQAVEGLAGALAPGGRVCLSDVVIDRAGLPDELLGMVGRIACVAEALPVDGYIGLLEGSGLRVCGLEQHDAAVVDMVERIDARLAIAAAAGGEALAGLDLARARELAAMAIEAARDGALGYVLMTAELEEAALEYGRAGVMP